MESWSLLDGVKRIDSIYYLANFFSEGTPNLEVDLILSKRPGTRSAIIRVDAHLPATTTEDEPISPGRLRAIPYGKLQSMADAYIDSLGEWQQNAPLEREALVELYDFKQLRAEWPKGDLDTVCEAVAEVYLSAYGMGEPPKEYVAQLFGTSTATAGRMIAKARELGKLSAVSVGGRPKRKAHKDNGTAKAPDR